MTPTESPRSAETSTCGDLVHEIVLHSHATAWQGYLSFVVSNLSGAGVVAAEIWGHVSLGVESELRRLPGGLFVEASFTPPAGAEEQLRQMQREVPPNAPGLGLAGNHWPSAVDAMDGSKHNDSKHNGSIWLDMKHDAKHEGSTSPPSSASPKASRCSAGPSRARSWSGMCSSIT